MDFVGAQGRGGVRREEGIARARHEEDHAILLEVTHRATADEGLRDLADLDGRHEPRRHRPLLERILQREPVDHRREEPHVVARDPVDPLRGRRHAPDDVAPAEHDGHLDAQPVDVLDLVGQPRHDVRRNAELLVPHQRLSRELQEDAAVNGFSGHRAAIIFETRPST